MDNFLTSSTKLFRYYKTLVEQAIDQIDESSLFWQLNENSNSIAIIMQHMSGNMLSRWTDFLTTDGEKDWRNRDQEFEVITSDKKNLIAAWEKGWSVLLGTLEQLTTEDLTKIIYIRNQGQIVLEAIQRQLAHYPYHVGQIVLIAKMRSSLDWTSLSIPKGNSALYNSEKFAKEQSQGHFTDEFLKDKE
jgi:Protein of unknown function (DUF1572)